MPSRHVNLTPELDQRIADRVASGNYENASEVVRAALRALDQEEQRHAAKLARLRTAIDAGDSSPDAEDGVFSRVRARFNLSPAR